MKLKILLNIHDGTIEEIKSACSLLTQTALVELVEQGEESHVYQHMKECGSITLHGRPGGGGIEELVTLNIIEESEYTDFSSKFRQMAVINDDDEFNEVADAMDDLKIINLHDLKGALVLAKSKVTEINGEGPNRG